MNKMSHHIVCDVTKGVGRPLSLFHPEVLHQCDMTDVYVSDEVFIRDMSHSYVWHDSFIYDMSNHIWGGYD